jgi:GH24 family phage-related lysozyme (muramidase)
MIRQMEGTGPMKGGTYFPYLDTEGLITIGIGYCLERNGLAADIVERLFKESLAEALDAVRHNFSCYDQLSRPRQLVLCSMGFQFGKAGLAKWPRFISAVHLGKYDEAADHLLDSKVAKEQAPMRFKTLAKMMRESSSEWV